MSKLKVQIINLIKLFCAAHTIGQRPQIYILTFFKSFRDFVPFSSTQPEDKISRYWGPQSVVEVIAVADKLFDEERYLEVYELLNRIKYRKEVEVLWRIARALYNLSFENVTGEMRWKMMEEAQDVLDMALAEGEANSSVHKWIAIVLDATSGMVSLEQRVKTSMLVREHLMKACQLNPTDFTTHYMLGKWCYEMSELSWLHRMIAKYLIAAEPPRSTYEEAYRYLSRAEELQPRTFLPNIFLLAKTCIEMGQFYKAKYYLNLLVNLPPKDACEICLITRAGLLIQKLERYDLGKNVLFYDSYHFDFTE
ncbi:hypothetical protein NQ317_011856 [Molorchus minor]|uniref:Regulator of microtubule dynamics protein 1 n=1 Tax=Molorchus minor TaxID=1323400 RepID=A0ABQ9JNE0_9CUCU|nr:hypothetical protein NQ317_011856 [Molorchus minor]